MRRTPFEGWDSALPKESRPSLSLGRSVSGGSLSFFWMTNFPDSFNPLSIHVSEFRGNRDGETCRRAKCAYGRHGGGRHARCADCPEGRVAVSHGDQRDHGNNLNDSDAGASPGPAGLRSPWRRPAERASGKPRRM